MPIRLSPFDRRKRSMSPGRDEHRDRRRRQEESGRDEKDRDRRWSSKRSFEQDHKGSKHQRINFEQRDRGKRRSDDEDEEGEEKPTRVSRFVGERKPEEYRRAESGGRGFESALPDNRRQYPRNDRYMPLRWEESAGRRGYDGGYRVGGAGAGYSRRSSSFGRWGGGRGGRGGRGRTIVYRPGEEEQKPTMNLFDPSKVPKGRSYFEHEDRSAEANRRFRGRARGRFSRGRAYPSSWRSPPDSSGRSEDVWEHDMFEEMETNETSPAKEPMDVTMEEANDK